MPQRDYSRIAGRKHESVDYFPFLNAFSSRAGDDLSELICQNGHVSVQEPPSRVSRASFVNNLSCGVHSESIVGQKVGILHDILPTVPSSELDSCLNNELASWLDYPFDVDMEQEYAPQRLPEVSVVGLSGQNSCELDLTNLDSGEKGPPFSYKPYFPWPSQNPQTSGVSDNISNQVEFVVENQDQGRDMFTDGRQRRSHSKMVNFPHFSKQSAANLLNPVGIPACGGSNSNNNNTDFPVSSAPEMVSNAVQELTKRVLNEDLVKETGIENEKLQVHSSEHLEKQVTGNEVPVERNVACSSVGSGHGAEVVSSDQTNRCKRKSCEADDSGSHSEDDDIVNIADKKHAPTRQGSVLKRSEVLEFDRDHSDGKKPAPPCKGTTGSKRSRVAEVHNLSERRRRDRINEKMKALQELIPNCNKADKASMLGEAIEYLKMLQFQVQCMSMGGGLCMPVMFPQGIQPMYPHLSPFPPMGGRISAGFGVGMVDNRPPIFRANVPEVPHFTSPVSAPSNMFRVTGPGFPVYGPQTLEQRSQPVPINPPHTAIPASTKQPCPSMVLNPMNPNSETSSQLTSTGVVSQQSHQVEAVNQYTQGANTAHSHVTK